MKSIIENPVPQSKNAIIQAFVNLGLKGTTSFINESIICSALLEPGERLVNMGQKQYNLYFIQSGLLKIVFCNKSGREFIRAFVANGMFYIPLTSYLLNAGAECYVEAIEHCEIQHIPLSVIEKGLETSIGLNKVWRGYMNQHFIRHERREIDLLSSDATQRYINFLEDYPDLDSRLPRHLVASYLGVTEPSLSRIRKNIST